MKIYRIMCKEEFEKTKKNGKPDFLKRKKFFSPNLQWVRERVMDGKFNNSNYKTERYTHLCEFEWDGKKAKQVGRFELMFDRRDNPNIRFIRLIECRDLKKGEENEKNKI